LTGVQWLSSWYEPGESLWSIANKVAFVHATSVSEVLGYLVGARVTAREAYLFPPRHGLSNIRRLLGESDPSAIRGCVHESETVTLAERWRWSMAIKYCPDCLEGFTHKVRFQEIAADRCHLHGRALVTHCPGCGSAIDPFAPAAWTCADCGGQLVVPGENWLHQFKSHSGGLVAKRDERVGVSLTPVWGEDVDQYRLAHVLYEEHAALSAALLSGHLACMDGERLESSKCPDRWLHFRCPVAGSLLFIAHQLGFEGQCLDAAWVPVRPRKTDALKSLIGFLATLPKPSHDSAARSTLRQWLLELLEAATSAAHQGHHKAGWDPHSCLRKEALKQTVYAASIEDAAAFASRFCPSASTTDVPHQEI